MSGYATTGIAAECLGGSCYRRHRSEQTQTIRRNRRAFCYHFALTEDERGNFLRRVVVGLVHGDLDARMSHERRGWGHGYR